MQLRSSVVSTFQQTTKIKDEFGQSIADLMMLHHRNKLIATKGTYINNNKYSLMYYNKCPQAGISTHIIYTVNMHSYTPCTHEKKTNTCIQNIL